MIRGREVELVAAVIILLIAAAGALVWAEWGLLVAFDAVVQYCF